MLYCQKLLRLPVGGMKKKPQSLMSYRVLDKIKTACIKAVYQEFSARIFASSAAASGATSRTKVR